MASRPIELILAKQWSDLLGRPALLIAASGEHLSHNEAAHALLGAAFHRDGGEPRADWDERIRFVDDDGEQSLFSTAVGRALKSGLPEHGTYVLTNTRSTPTVRVSAIPVHGLDQTLLGVLVVLHEESA